MMVFKRKGSKRLYFQARTETGWRQQPTGTTNRVQAQKVEAMWERLALEHRAWDLLNPVLAGDVKVTRLWDLWRETRESVPEMRRRMADSDLAPLVTEWAKVYGRQRPANAPKNVALVRTLIAEGSTLPRSQVTTAWLTERLYAHTGKASTLRGLASAWSMFFAYLTDVHGLFDLNPMLRVKRPSPTPPSVKFFELDAVDRIVAYQPTPALRAFYAIAYGAGIETGVSLNLTRADLNQADKEIRAYGTKTATRDRMARVSAWAWPIIWKHAKELLPTARLFPADWRDDQVSKWHADTLKALGLPHLKLHNARHFWAVNHLRAGVPLEVVRRQLGHSTPVLTLKTYGQFIPSGEDRAKWEAAVVSDQARRREAK